METFLYLLTQVHLENGHYNGERECCWVPMYADCCLLTVIPIYYWNILGMVQCLCNSNNPHKLVPECRIIRDFLQQEMTRW